MMVDFSQFAWGPALTGEPGMPTSPDAGAPMQILPPVAQTAPSQVGAMADGSMARPSLNQAQYGAFTKSIADNFINPKASPIAPLQPMNIPPVRYRGV